jgi:hypothetical protein
MRDEALQLSYREPGVAKTFPVSCARAALPTPLQAAEASQYRNMEAGLRATGGFASSDEMVFRLRRHTDQPISRLARWIVDRHVISIEWQGRTMLPLFQFEPSTLVPRTEVTAVIRELVPALSDWEITLWFAEPNVWLDEHAPADAVLRDAAAVFNAALAERYLARG